MSSAKFFLVQSRRKPAHGSIILMYRNSTIGLEGRARCVTGIDLHITVALVSSQEPLQLDYTGEASEAVGTDRP